MNKLRLGTAVRADYNTQGTRTPGMQNVMRRMKRPRHGERGLSPELQVFLRHPSLPAIFREHCVDPV